MNENSNYARYVEEGNTFCFLHDYSRAIFAYTAAINENPPPSVLASIYSNRAYCYTKLDMLTEARADVTESLEIDPMSQSTNTISEYYETALVQKTGFPLKSQKSFSPIPYYVTTNYLTTCSEKIDESDENKSVYYAIRATAFAQRNFYKEAISDFVNARKFVEDPTLLPKLAYQAVLAHQNVLAEEIIRYCSERKIDCSIAKGVLAFLNFEYRKAYDLFNTQPNESIPNKYMTFIHFSLGNVSKAYHCSRNYFLEENYFMFLQKCLRILSCNDLPNYCEGSYYYAVCVNYLIAGIYMSLRIPIRDVPLDLFMPRVLLSAGAQLAGTTSLEAALGISLTPAVITKVPESFDGTVKDEQEADRMMKVAARLRVTSSPNKREHICTGLALIQVVQMLQDKHVPELRTCAAAITHWLRLTDPTVLFFWRATEKIRVFMHRESFDTVLSCYSSSIFMFLKRRLKKQLSQKIPLRAGQSDMQTAIDQSKNPDELGAIFKSGVVIPICSQVSIFYNREQEGYSFGLEVNPPTKKMTEDITVSWCTLCNMVKSRELSKEHTERFIEKATEFLFQWMYSSPLTSLNDIVGYILYRAILWSYFGKDVILSNPEPIIMHVDALLTNFNPLYQMYILPHIQLKTDGESVEGFMKIEELFPSYLHRIRALLNIGSEEIPEKCDPREYIKPVYYNDTVDENNIQENDDKEM